MDKILCIIAFVVCAAVALAAPMLDDGASEPVYIVGHPLLETLQDEDDDRYHRAPDAYAPVDGFHEGPNRGVYTQPDIFEGHRRPMKEHENRGDEDISQHRNRREASPYPYPYPYPYPVAYSPVDGFFEGPNRGVYTQPAPFQGPTRFDANDNDYDSPRPRQKKPAKKPTSNRRQEFVGPQGPPPPSKGNKYVYQPLFKYKATQQKHHKLFVPNIFGWIVCLIASIMHDTHSTHRDSLWYIIR